MKLNRLFLCLCAVLNVCMAWGQQTPLRFNKDGKFKIVQLTDIHYKYDDQANSQVGIDCINKVLDAEKPDCVIITGDGVVSNESFKAGILCSTCALVATFRMQWCLVIMMMSMTIPAKSCTIIFQRRRVA